MPPRFTTVTLDEGRVLMALGYVVPDAEHLEEHLMALARDPNFAHLFIVALKQADDWVNAK